jgi:hypothetical protein
MFFASRQGAFALDHGLVYYLAMDHHAADAAVFDNITTACLIAVEQRMHDALYAALPGLALYYSSHGQYHAGIETCARILSLDDTMLHLRTYSASGVVLSDAWQCSGGCCCIAAL